MDAQVCAARLDPRAGIRRIDRAGDRAGDRGAQQDRADDPFLRRLRVVDGDPHLTVLHCARQPAQPRRLRIHAGAGAQVVLPVVRAAGDDGAFEHAV